MHDEGSIPSAAISRARPLNRHFLQLIEEMRINKAQIWLDAHPEWEFSFPPMMGGADNVNVTPGAGAIIATRDAGGGVEVQRVIPNTFAGGVATDVSTTNPLPIAITGGVNGVLETTVGGRTTTTIASGTIANTVIRSTPCRLFRVLVTATGTAALSIFDNATTNAGTIIGIVPANAAVGGVYDFQMPAANGITVGGAAANPGVTISFT